MRIKSIGRSKTLKIINDLSGISQALDSGKSGSGKIMFSKVIYKRSRPGAMGYNLDMAAFLDKLPWFIIIMACLTLGLAPYSPPHVWEKLQMLFRGKLVRPIDWFDLVMHAAPWALLILKGIYEMRKAS